MSAAGDVNPAGLRKQKLDRIAALVLRDEAVLTREQAAAAAGLTLDRARPYWRAMGFADVGTDRAFTGTDVQSLRTLVEWVDDGVLDEASSIDLVRSLGRTASRLAEWQVDSMTRVLAESGSPVDLDELAEGLADVLPGLESLLVHAWRRHLAAAMGRGLAAMAEEPETSVDPARGTVGFADIAGFTRLGRVLGDDELARIVQVFESGAADIVAAHGARLVKTLGDEVMFVSRSPDNALAIADAMQNLPAPGPDQLTLRIGLATGHLVSRMGDFYGRTVNRASRLTAVARPGAILIDAATEDALADRAAHSLRHLPPRPMRGIGLVRATSVSRRRA